MTRINSSDQVLLLLRERLQRLGRERGARAPKAATGSSTPSPIARLQALAALEELPGDELRRGLVRALLTEEAGDAAANDAAFQAIADEVFRIIDGSEEGRDLIDRAARQLRAEG